jgi:cysteine-rich repeat protein
MKGTPDSNGLCLCKDKYQEDSTGVCRDICGDGYLMQTSSSSCDDGNSDNGDGCSSQCQVETYYKCENGSSTTPSVCVYRGIPLSLNLSQIERTEGMNQGVFLFDVSPPLININRMDLRQCVELECELTAYAVSKIAYSSGTLEIIADYTEDMEGRACLLTFSYNASVIISPNSTLSFEAVSRNAPLIVSHKLDFFAQFRVIFRSLSYVALGVFVASLSHKLIGA